MTNVALIVAAGRGARFGADRPKQYLALAGEAILRRSARTFLEHESIAQVLCVIRPEDRDMYDVATQGLALPKPVAGGATRQESVLKGLEALAGLKPGHVLIHDAARPLVGTEVISDVIAALETSPGAVPALGVTDSLKRGREGRIVESLPRDDLWRAQTPQGFDYGAILAAHRRAAGADVEYTDDAQVAEAAGLAVALVAGSEENIKVTTTDDLRRAERLLEGTGAPVARQIRVGTGFDVHRFGGEGPIWLCGVAIESDSGLAGHSDADVALHAITDAILGAIAAGDIGEHFPPGDPQWAGASSARFLRHAADLVEARGGAIVAVDLTIVCERPKIGPHRTAMRMRIAEILGITVERISVKSTTTDGLGFTGRREGIAAQATVTVGLA